LGSIPIRLREKEAPSDVMKKRKKKNVSGGSISACERVVKFKHRVSGGKNNIIGNSKTMGGGKEGGSRKKNLSGGGKLVLIVQGKKRGKTPVSSYCLNVLVDGGRDGRTEGGIVLKRKKRRAGEVIGLAQGDTISTLSR